MSKVDLPDWVGGPSSGGSQIFNSGSVVVAPGGQLDTGRLDVSSYDCLFVRVSLLVAGTSQVQKQFWTSPTGVAVLGSQVTFSKKAAAETDWVQPVLGPYFQVIFHNNDVGNLSAAITIIGFASPLIPTAPQVNGIYIPVSVQGVSVPNNASTVFAPAVCMPGRARLFLNLPVIANVAVGIERWTNAAWELIYQAARATGQSADSIDDIALPLDDWRVSAPNFSGAAQTVTAVVTMEG